MKMFAHGCPGRHAKRAVDEAVQAINWLHGVDCRPKTVHSNSEFAARRTSELHLEAQQRMEEAVLRWPSAVCAPDDSSPLREMLKGRGGDKTLRFPRRT